MQSTDDTRYRMQIIIYLHKTVDLLFAQETPMTKDQSFVWRSFFKVYRLLQKYQWGSTCIYQIFLTRPGVR